MKAEYKMIYPKCCMTSNYVFHFIFKHAKGKKFGVLSNSTCQYMFIKCPKEKTTNLDMLQQGAP